MQKAKRAGGRVLSWTAWALLFPLSISAAASCGGDGEQPVPPTPTRGPSRTTTATAAVSPAPTVGSTESPAPATVTVTEAPIRTPPPDEPRPAIGLLTVVDKQHALAADYVPADLVALGAAYLAPGFPGSLRAEAKTALERMLSDAYAQGHNIYARSAYRSYAEQERTFAYWVSVLGETEARRVSAEAGHSEHQLGTTADLTTPDIGYDLTETFGETPAGHWLADNAHTYGFALSYPAGAEAVTGYAYEPWHFRYVGADHAAAWKASGVTLGEYLRGLEG